VGLFSAAMCGIDIDALLEGAAAMDAVVSDPDPAVNPRPSLPLSIIITVSSVTRRWLS
jgi:glucose-6-phosphate isomerase